jgi:hypothetical protein
MSGFDGSLALKLDFGEMTATTMTTTGRRALRLASPSGQLPGPEKYRVLEQRRREAQIKARRLLDLLD